MKAYSQLVAHFKKIAHFQHLSAICGWDQAAMMPSGGATARAGAMAELHGYIHQLMTAPQLADWITEAEQLSLNPDAQASLREIKRQWQNASVLPQALVEAQSLAGAHCEQAWRTQKANNDWQGYAKLWAEVVQLSREEAQIRAAQTATSPYDALLQMYEPGNSTTHIDAVFNEVKNWLPNLIDSVIEKQASDTVYYPQGHYPAEKQKALGLDIMAQLQFDFSRGRLDESIHPFCGGVPSDVRLTTHYHDTEFVQSIMGIIHETGHARYEQGLPTQFSGLPVGEARSMGIHESQSLFFEMQLGRDPQFIKQLVPQLTTQFGQPDDPVFTCDNLIKLYTRVQKGLVRIDADEVTYPAHIILRYEIERDLINGVIDYQDVPELWDHKMQQYLGLSTKGNDKDGCMQDIHWTDGSFGYFPSYTLGAMYAAQFMTAMKKTVDVNDAIQSGDLSPVFNWLADNIWSKGSLMTTEELVQAATGETLNPEHFKQHLMQRYL